jgi:glycosyltransferase involved in cell wall biosynthesis
MRICVLSENSYPVSRGGVSEWCHLLIKNMDDVDFDIFTISPEKKILYEPPKNLVERHITRLNAPKLSPTKKRDRKIKSLIGLTMPVLTGNPIDCRSLQKHVQTTDFTAEKVLSSEENWEVMIRYYQKRFPTKAFIPFYLSWVSLFYLLYKMLEISVNVPKADVYHALNAGYAGFLGCLVKTQTGSPLVITEHGLYLKERKFELRNSEVPEWLHEMYESFFYSLVKTSYKYSDEVTTVCEDHIEYIKEVYPNLKPKVVYNGIDVERFELNDLKNDGIFNIGTVSRIHPIKDIMTLIRAAYNVVQKHQAHFFIVGEVQDKEYYDDCLNLVDELDLNSEITFTGFQDSAEWYPKFDMFVLSSISEGFPLTILEALSSGIPCIATNVGGIPEILSNDFLVEKWDYERLATKISSLLESSDTRRTVGERGRELVSKKFHFENMIEEYREIYEAHNI